MIINEPVQVAIWQCLKHFNYDDSIFLCERLYAEVGSDVALHLLASSYYRIGKVKSAYLLLQNKIKTSTDCRLLYAQCCIDLEKYSEGEMALNEGILVQKSKSLEVLITEFGENASFAIRILGLIYLKTERKADAIECFKQSLKLNPFLWSCFQYLCDLGADLDLNKIFPISNEDLNFLCSMYNSAHSTHTSSSHNNSIDSAASFQEDDYQSKELIIEALTPDNQRINENNKNHLHSTVTATCKRNCTFFTRGHSAINLSPLNGFGSMPEYFTPSPKYDSQQINSPLLTNLKDSPMPKPLTLFGNSRLSVFNQASKNTNLPKESQQNNQQNIGPRRSSRLFSNIASSSVKENNKNQISVPRTPTKRLKSKLALTHIEINEKNKSEDLKIHCVNNSNIQAQILLHQMKSAKGLMELLRCIAKGYTALQKYKCEEAIQLFKDLPAHHLNTSWVLSHIGIAYFEIANYKSAEETYSELRELCPYYMNGMEIYSSVLWHLQQEFKLSALASELSDMDKYSPEAWCATGNCFSLQKEHDIAIKFFQRAIQCNPNFAYAYTLLGHEYVLIEELDKAMNAFQNAVRINSKHYNAWYGIGMVFYKQEKYSSALLYYEKALSINPNSPILLCHVGVVESDLKKYSSALKRLEKAISIDPNNVLPKFHHAAILSQTENYKDALKELHEIKDKVPNESLVYFHIGKIYKKIGQLHLAYMNFSWAMELDPKGMNTHIKENINKRFLNEEDDWMVNFVTPANPSVYTTNNVPVEAFDMYPAD